MFFFLLFFFSNSKEIAELNAESCVNIRAYSKSINLVFRMWIIRSVFTKGKMLAFYNREISDIKFTRERIPFFIKLFWTANCSSSVPKVKRKCSFASIVSTRTIKVNTILYTTYEHHHQEHLWKTDVLIFLIFLGSLLVSMTIISSYFLVCGLDFTLCSRTMCLTANFMAFMSIYLFQYDILYTYFYVWKERYHKINDILWPTLSITVTKPSPIVLSSVIYIKYWHHTHT